MCGIFGMVAKDDIFSSRDIEKISRKLFLLSESRGKESAGIAFSTEEGIRVFKSPLPASTMIRNSHYKKFFKESFQINGDGGEKPLSHPVTFIGHSRLVTNGSQENHDNNQPVIKDGIVAIHNGIIVNDDQLWSEFPLMKRNYQVDTEVALSLIKSFYRESSILSRSVSDTYSMLEGTASMAMLFNDQRAMLLATNNGSLYVGATPDRSVYIFASEKFILEQFLKTTQYQNVFSNVTVWQVRPGTGFVVDTVSLVTEEFLLQKSGNGFQGNTNEYERSPLPVIDFTPEQIKNSAKSTFVVPTAVPESVYKKYEIDETPIVAMKRCTRCILPETMPFIEFDENGICNYCRMYQKQSPMGESELEGFVDRYRSKNGSPDCVITFSGGRDSSYALHYVKTVLKMNPVAYTYDWGMVTDLARRNQARLCGKLGVEHILVSADINQKREYIRKNVLAWLRRPHLGTIPLFMAGDKQYFYYANQMKQQLGVNLIILAANPLEETFFKSGFCGLPPSLTRPTLAEQFKLAFFYGREFLFNPAYLNSSLVDTVGAFASYYTIPHDYLRFFQYLLWDETHINSVLHDSYDWETASDTKVTWRIGDGTAAFYNYIYYSVAGFSENDTFRSNQIREGMISRDDALLAARRDNYPRYESIQWYCDTIGVDMDDVLTRIGQIPRLYSK
jgi:asparagine synthetase B (glutamine-hydrolysing)